MSMIQSDLLLGQEGEAGYTISRSLRFNSSDSAYLSRVVSTAGDRKKWTLSLWVKRSGLGQDSRIFSAATSGSNQAGITFNTDNTIEIFDYQGSYGYRKVTTQVFRDASAWYHLLLAADFDNATAEDRLQFYVNGSRVTSFSTNTNPSSGYSTGLINSAVQNGIGAYTGPAALLNGYVADVIFIDGQQLTPSSFTEVDATTGQLIPKAYTGTYGTNGFHLDFADNSAATAAALGKDTSGNGNNFTPNNLSVTAGAGNDSLTDTPTSGGTDTGLGGQVTGNYATLNPLAGGANSSQITLSNGNLDALWSSAIGYAVAVATIGVSSGKWYWEVTHTQSGTRTMIGVVQASADLASYIGTTGPAYDSAGYTWRNDVNTAATSYGVNDIIGIALDLDNGKIWFAKNGTWLGSGNPAGNSNPVYSSLSGTFFPAISEGDGNSPIGVTCNFGQRPFAYTAPSGYKALCTQNLPDPTITNPSTVMDVKLYTGNGSTQTISGLGFSPDFVWIKGRSFAEYHGLFDTVRGTGKVLFSNTTDAENSYTASTQNLTAFNSDSFSLGTDGPLGTNRSSITYAAWCFDAGANTVSNTAGSITSQVRANASAGFSIVTWTNPSTANQTIGHGLNVKPAMIIRKYRNNADGWVVYHTSLGQSSGLFLNTTGAASADANLWPGSINSTVFSTGNLGYFPDGWTAVAYCFAPVAGYSSFGSVNLTPTADGAFIYLGFRPRFFLIKGTDNTSNWIMLDSQRDPFNFVDQELFSNLSNAENTASSTYSFDFLSNGVKARNQGLNGSFIYAAWAESPFAYSRAR